MVLKAMQDDELPSTVARVLQEAWVRHQWRRASETQPDVRGGQADILLEEDIEAVIQICNAWYGEMMFQCRIAARWESGDSLGVCPVDGNANFYWRTCGAPCAESVYSEELDLFVFGPRLFGKPLPEQRALSSAP